MYQSVFVGVWAAGIILTMLGALLRGGWEERAGAAASLAAWLLTILVLQITQAWVGPHAGLFVIDATLFATLLAIGLRSQKRWPLIASGFQLCGLGLHAAYWAQPHVWSAAYFVGLQVTSLAVLVVISSAVVASLVQSERR